MIFGSQHASMGVNLRYWLHSTPTGPEGLGVRFTFTLVFSR
jgi:hypothetical protein